MIYKHIIFSVVGLGLYVVELRQTGCVMEILHSLSL